MPNKQDVEKHKFIKDKGITEADKISIEKHGKSIEDIVKNYNLIIETFSKGVNFVNLERPLIESDVRILSNEDLGRFENQYNSEILKEINKLLLTVNQW